MDQSSYWQQSQHGAHSHFQQYSNSGQYQNQNTYPQYDPNVQMSDHFHYSNQDHQQNVTRNQQFQDSVAGGDWEESWGWGEEDNSNFHSGSQQISCDPQNFNSNPNVTEETFTNDESWNWSIDDTSRTSAQSSHNREFQKTGTRTKEVTNLQFPHNHTKSETFQWSESSTDIGQQEANSNYLSSTNSATSQVVSSSSSLELIQNHNKKVGDIPSKQGVQVFDKGNFISQDTLENEEIVANPRREFQSIRPQSTLAAPSKFSTSQQSSFTSFPQASSEEAKNPYRQASSKSKFPNSNISAPSVPPSTFHLYSQPVNLETLPDNSERPDQLPPRTGNRKTSVSTTANQQWQENNEVPINDRNQYLETGRLSAAEVPQDSQHDNNDTPPPPGLRRMVLGQLEQEGGSTRAEPSPGFSRMVPGQTEMNDNGMAGNQSMELPIGLSRMVPGQMENNDNEGFTSMEPPVGLSRMVPGQMETNDNNTVQVSQGYNPSVLSGFSPIEPPEGLHRMVPGESSSPESISRQQRQSDIIQDEPDFTFNQSEQRSAMSGADGADTPPASVVFPIQTPVSSSAGRPERVGVDVASSTSLKSAGENRQRSQNVSNDNRPSRTGATSSSVRSKESSAKKQDSVRNSEDEDDYTNDSRRDPVEGEPQETISTIVNAIRNLTVGENVNDEVSSSDDGEPVPKHHSSRQTSSESEPELRAVAREHKDSKDKRHKGKYEKRDRNDRRRDENETPKERRYDHDERSRYSPDQYRPKDKKQSGKSRHRDKKFEEDTDYYSDRERRSRDDRIRERNYSSLQRDKGRRRDKERDYNEYMEREYRKSYYYGESLNESMSRASSRSDSMHNAYRGERGYEGHHRHREYRHHEKDKHKRYRDPYGPYLQGFGYDPYSPYYQHYQYYEAMRRNNPQAYAEWYRKYYQQNSSHATYDTEERGSVHSGRSSANETGVKDRFVHSFEQPESSLNLDDTLTSQRLTPAKYATAHIKGSISSGRLVRILPNYPLDGQQPVVELCNMEALFSNDEFKELMLFPGPLMRGTTHKKTIIEYCESKIKIASYNNIVDADSYVLLWELLILLIRQNGMVVGADIAELLLKNRTYEQFQRSSSVVSSVSSSIADLTTMSEGANQQSSEVVGGSTSSVLKETEITNKFRDYLLYGSVKEALEWAMKNSLWGHALFLASKLDKRTYASVITRFANGLALNDPLQTLYQLLSGRTPSVVTCIADDKWGDWRPHLAMILSNTTQYPELNCRAVTTLGDTLLSKGCIYAAQFCYLMAEVGFGSYNDKTSKLVLLGGDHSKPFEQFATNEAIHMTEIYEYACSLNNSDFAIPSFQIYKYLLATRLADCGLLDKSLAYLEKIADYIIQNSSLVDSKFVNSVYNLSDRLKYNDVLGDTDGVNYDENLDANRPDNTWLKQLRNLMYDNSMNSVPQYSTESVSNEFDQSQPILDPTAVPQQSWQEVSQQYTQQQQNSEQQWWNGQNIESNQFESQPPSMEQQLPEYNSQQEPLWSNQNTQWQQENVYKDDFVTNQQDSNQFQSYNSSVDHVEDPPMKPQISMPNQPKGSRFDESFEEDNIGSPPSPVKPKPKPEPVQQAKSEKSSTGWFGGIFSRLAPKPKNQMKLPDDKNPTIVWDPVKKRWVNNEDDGNGAAADLKPPPKMSDLPRVQTLKGNPQIPQNIPDNSFSGHQQGHSDNNDRSAVPKPVNVPGMVSGGESQTAQLVEPKIAADPNMFRLQGRGRNLKKSYVDVFNPAGRKVGGPQAPVPDSLSSTGIQQPNFFIPQPVNDPNAPADFLTPSVPYSDNSQGDRGQYQ